MKNDVLKRRPLNFGNSQFPTTFRNLVKFVENFHSFSLKTPYGNHEANCFGHEEEKVTNPFEGRLGSRLRAWSSQDFRRVVVVQGEKMTWNGVEDSYENHRVTRLHDLTAGIQD